MNAKTIAVLSLAAAGFAFAETPDKFVRYVESTGSQYVDTGVTGRWNTKVEAQVEWMNFADSALIGSRISGSTGTRLYFCYCLNADGNMYTTTYGGGEKVIWNGSWEPCWEKNRIYDYSSEFSATNAAGQTTNIIRVDGLDLWSKAGNALDTGYSLHLFACNVGGTASYNSKARIYRLKIWQGPKDGGDMTLQRDLVPCMKNGKAGLYDAVSGDILYGSGADLVCDEDSETPDEFVEYVESTGMNFIDTEVAARSGTEAEIEVATLHKRTFRKGLLGAITSGNVYFDLFHSYEASMACSYGTRLTTGGSYSNGEKYYFRSSLAAGAQTLVKANYDVEPTTNTVYEGTNETSIDTGLSLYLFGRNSNGNIADCGIYRLYGLKIKQDNVLVRDFKPCLKNGEFALYDDVSKRIFHAKRGLLNGPLNTIVVGRNAKIKFVEYIESSGWETLDTGVRARAGTRAKGEFAWATALRTKATEENTYLEAPIYRNGRCYLGADDPTYWPTFFYMMYAENQKIWGGYGNGLGNNSVTYGASTSISMTTAGTKYSFDASFMDGEQKVELDGTQIWTLSNSANFDSGKNLHLFSSGSRYRSAARCYGLEIWQDGEKVRDFKPCVYDGKAMLYDTISKTLYRPSPDIPESKAGPGVFTGEEKPVCFVDYVESDGTIFVDTGVTGKSGTKADVKMRFLEKGDLGFLDSRSGNTRFYMWHNYTKHDIFGFGYGQFQSYGSSGDGKTDADYDVKVTLAQNRQEITVNGVSKWTTGQDTTYINPSDNINTGYNLYLFAMNQDGSPTYAGKARLYYLKLYQGDSDGSNMKLVRNLKPVRLSNDVVVLWDFVEKKAYRPQLVSSPGTYTTFTSVGADGEAIRNGVVIILR